MKANFKKFGFTLAEVLITLGIIGVVAALIIPILVQNSEERAIVTALKKAYSVLYQASIQAIQENGTPDNWGITGANSPEALSYFLPYLKIDKNCLDNSQGCFPKNVAYYYLTSSKGSLPLDGWRPSLRLAGGILIQVNAGWSDCSASYGTTNNLKSICSIYLVDVNGDKGPNIFGKDTFTFLLNKYGGIIPSGVQQQTGWYYFTNDCQNKDNAFGLGCTGWVISNNNMDYLHCNDLSWGGKTTCN